jgi:hypothetical protein
VFVHVPNIVIEYCGINCANGFGGGKRET